MCSFCMEINELGNLFLCEDYIVKDYQFGDLQQSILCSNMSSTDHDLTGQIIWPAAKLMSWFIATKQPEFHHQVIVELGAGAGLAGFIASQLGSHTVITDGNEVVLRLIDRNIDKLAGNISGHVSSMKLMWGEKDQLLPFIQSRPDVIIGADIILWPSYVRPLALTVRWLLAFKPMSSKCYISYVVRAHSTTKLFLKSAAELGLDVSIIPSGDFLPPVIAEPLASEPVKNSTLAPSEDMFIFKVTLSPTFVAQLNQDHLNDNFSIFDLIPPEDPSWRDFADHQNSPC